MAIQKEHKTHELDFWTRFIESERFSQQWCGEKKTPEMNDEVFQFISDNLPKGGKILDVGSGPVSILHGPFKEITAVDPLANDYKKIVDYKGLGIKAPRQGYAETFKSSTKFDIVHCRNSFDHCQDPEKAYTNLMGLVKKGGYLIIHGFENEGQHENYQGLHQWDIQVDDIFFMFDKDGELVFKVSDEAEIAKTINLPNIPRRWVIWIAKK